jgi:NUMOD3 motif-containing protein
MNPRAVLQERYPTANLVVYFAFIELCRLREPKPLRMMTQEHHICPKKQFPEHKDAPENLITLWTPLHWHAHRLLSAAVPELSTVTAAWKSACQSPEARRKNGEAHRGLKCSAETRRKLSAALRGNHNARGSNLSEEHRRKISQANLGRKLSEETRRKMSEGRRGKKRT